MDMVAVRALLSTLNSLTQSGLQASGLLPDQNPVDRGAAAQHAPAAEPWGEGEYAEGGVEPLLEELLRDPVVRLMMQADRLEPDQVGALLRSRRWQAEP